MAVFTIARVLQSVGFALVLWAFQATLRQK
jgi:hypothetical protein